MEQRFDDRYVFSWMSARGGQGGHESLTRWLRSQGAILDGLSPAFLNWFERLPDRPRGIERRHLRSCTPPWYWERLSLCALRYHEFFARLWPDLACTVDGLLYVEWLHHLNPDSKSDHYRDHLFHMFKVACLGTWLLTDTGLVKDLSGWQFGVHRAGQRNFNAWLPRRFPRDPVELDAEEKESILRWAFLLAALLHDFGYAYSFRKRLDEKCAGIHNWVAATTHNTEPTSHMQEVFQRSLANAYLTAHVACEKSRGAPTKEPARRLQSGLVRNLLTLNHGMSSALFILSLAERLRMARALNPHLQIAFEIAAEAVMLHDMTKDERWSGLHRNFLTARTHEEAPVAVLLMLCDELTVWNRPLLERKTGGALTVTHRLDLSKCVPAIRLRLDGRRLGVTVLSRVRARAHEVRDKLKDKIGKIPCLRDAGRGAFCGRELAVD